MKRLFCLTAVFVLSLAQTQSATALDDALVDRSLMIARNCKNAQTTMQGILRADTVTRINRGYAYDNMTKLMSAFSARAAYNSYNIPKLSEATAQFKTLRADFNETYKDYEAAMRDIVAMDCAAKPQLFYESLQSLRERRTSLNTHVSNIDKQFDTFRQGLQDIDSKIKAKETE